MTLGEAAKSGITKLRLPFWAPNYHMEIDIINGCYGPWGRIFGGIKTETILLLSMDSTEDRFEAVL